MTHHYLTRTIFLGCMLVGSAGFARAEIVKCVDQTATVTYTDVRCKDGAGVARASALSNPSPVRARVSSPARTLAAARKAREAILAEERAHNRKPALDVTTLKAARYSMLLNDQTSSLLRQQKLAALDQRSQRWLGF